MTAPTDPPDELPVLRAPADGVPEVIDSPTGLDEVAHRISETSGPVALDAERAHGFRYTTRAYLVQLRREGVGTRLIDPIGVARQRPRPGSDLADLTSLNTAIGESEWILHAATQDLPCLTELGLRPVNLFDTELAARLLGWPKVGLSSLVERIAGVRLLKEHSAADWSTRPLPPDWLVYASLDVELLAELREHLAAELVTHGKDEWARQEFAHLVATAGQPRKQLPEPWRRTSGLSQVKTRQGLALVRELWNAREELAQRLDKAPSKILIDKAISELAAGSSWGRNDLRAIDGFKRRNARRFEANWLDAIERAQALPSSKLPQRHPPQDGPPNWRNWERNHPEAHARLIPAREAINSLAASLEVPAENLLTPDYWRLLCWQPPAELTVETADAVLAGLGARPWQRELTVPPLVEAISSAGG
ncbi:HRDC domain-containing protein [Enemella sp. A6]|uniref:HRDC domain-containing protein n=1 Tax=Enemella sp. A6 TaxID=3440152 RepID=UPI003EC1292E